MTRAEQLLRGLGQVQDPRAGAHELAVPPECLGGAVEGVALASGR